MSTQDEECKCCGSRPDARKRYLGGIDASERTKVEEFTKCPFCSSQKCCMCDMGNDVRCTSCVDEEEDYE